ncbi:S1 domain-containing protein [Candidatus Annandia pinicola]
MKVHLFIKKNDIIKVNARSIKYVFFIKNKKIINII